MPRIDLIGFLGALVPLTLTPIPERREFSPHGSWSPEPLFATPLLRQPSARDIASSKSTSVLGNEGPVSVDSSASQHQEATSTSVTLQSLTSSPSGAAGRASPLDARSATKAAA